MNEQEKQEYLERYEKQKKRGVPFFPDVLFKDAVAALAVFLILGGLVFIVGTPLEARADPADTSYNPKPEWYFLFLFQLLKYFPGNLEVIGVFVIPTLLIILLVLLPFLDSSAKRHFAKRWYVTGTTAALGLGVVALTVLAVLEAPPPAAEEGGDPTAALYTQNCAPCHGPSVQVPEGTNLHEIIAQGSHEGMPAWSGDLTTDEIDALAGFILSPTGNTLFNQNCSQCHQTSDLVAQDPLDLKRALQEGSAYPPHEEVEVPEWSNALSRQERTSLLNFLVAPDGQRLYTLNCSGCHGRSVPSFENRQDLEEIIRQGGLHLEMPSWRQRLSDEELEVLARYVVDPEAVPEGEDPFQTNCSSCHGQRIPVAEGVEEARQIIASGGSHETMPVWGDILTEEQLDALVTYSMQAARGTPTEVGQELYAQYCSGCHGDFGEGGANPTRAGDVIAPISSAEYLRTRDDSTLRSIIAQGQPNFGMSPFGTAFGGPLEDDQIEAIVTFMRAWEENPPVELPPEVDVQALGADGKEIYEDVCAQCHGLQGEGIIGPSLNDPAYQSQNTDQQIFESINYGHGASAMIGWGEILTAEQIDQLVGYIRELGGVGQPTETGPTPAAAEAPSFSEEVMPIFQAECVSCHGTMGGWEATSYEAVMNTGDHAPVVIPGDPLNSLLGQKMLGTHDEGVIMPPAGKLPDDVIQIILDWIAAGAPDN